MSMAYSKYYVISVILISGGFEMKVHLLGTCTSYNTRELFYN